MTSEPALPLLVGEVFVDVSITPSGAENKLRLGGICHAARGFWALGVPFNAAVIAPSYLVDQVRAYLAALGCKSMHVAGVVTGAPNVTIVADATEVADQGYDSLLRDEKVIEHRQINIDAASCLDVLIFPGAYNLTAVCDALPPNAKLHLDVAYDVNEPTILAQLSQKIETVLISTSSPLFQRQAERSLAGTVSLFQPHNPATIILKENRGGSRLALASGQVENLPAQLGRTINSVGVGDVFAAAFVAHLSTDPIEAGWRATRCAAAYSQTTYPEVFKSYVQRDAKLTLDELKGLGGVSLPWERRSELEIYLAAPDFAAGDRRAIEAALTSLSYHNFVVRRPVLENGELPANSDLATLRRTYTADVSMLKHCAMVFAVPTARDPGTLVEIGIAIEAGIPVVVFDRGAENANTMVIAGAHAYSSDLDECLNATFTVLGKRAGS